MAKRFVGKWVVVTGAGGGLGQTAAIEFAREGARLILVDINPEGLAATTAEIQAQGAECLTHVLDLADEQAIKRFGEYICAAHPKIDVLFNNAGIAYGEINQSVETFGLEKWLRYLTINSIAPLLLAQALRPSLTTAKGTVINQSSIASYMPATVYGVTKATLNALTYGMATAFGPDGIRVNAIAPGLMETPASKASLSVETQARIQGMQMLNLHGKAADISSLALFLASDEARFINCEIVCCDAGSRVRGWRG